MDPDIALEEIRKASRALDEALQDIALFPVADAAQKLQGRFRALDEWLSRGGFSPRAWERKS
jgi:hypothetical protein